MNVYEISYQETEAKYVYTKTVAVLAENFEVAVAKVKLSIPKIAIWGGRVIVIGVML